MKIGRNVIHKINMRRAPMLQGLKRGIFQARLVDTEY